MQQIALLSLIGSIFLKIIKGGMDEAETGLRVVELNELLKLQERIQHMTNASIDANLKSIQRKHQQWLDELHEVSRAKGGLKEIKTS